MFTDGKPAWRLQELTDETGLPLSTLHRIAAVLKRHGLLLRDPATRAYRLGYGAIELGRRASSTLPLRAVADPIVRDLAKYTGETALVTVLNEAQNRAICVARAESRHDLRLHLDVGTSSHLHAGASSKVLLAFLGEPRVDDLFSSEGLPRLAAGTITDIEALKTELAQIRRQGYAFSRQETDEGACGVAVPIIDHGGRVVAGVGIAAPVSRYSKESHAQWLQLANQAAERLRENLGLVDPQPRSALNTGGTSSG